MVILWLRVVVAAALKLQQKFYFNVRHFLGIMGGGVSFISDKKHYFIDNLVLTSDQVQIVQDSWVEIELVGPAKFGDLAFKGLFRIAPETFSMFTSFCSMQDWENSVQYRHHCAVVLKVIGHIVKVLLDPTLLTRNMDYMGMRHSLLSIEVRHFDILGVELVKSFEELLHDKFPPQAKEAWIIVYDILSRMLRKHIASYSVMFEELKGKI